MDSESGIFYIVEIVFTILIAKHMRVNGVFNQCPMVPEYPVRSVGHCDTDTAVYRIIEVKPPVSGIVKNIGGPDSGFAGLKNPGPFVPVDKVT
jgi:hypothetical protein